MNVNTGELYRITNEEMLKKMKKTFGEAMQPVPEALADEANKVLGEHEYGRIGLRTENTLASWAKNERKKIKNKRKMAKKSRKVNRK